MIAVSVPGGTLHVVQGDYEYYHYMQDRFDDNVRSGFGVSFCCVI